MTRNLLIFLGIVIIVVLLFPKGRQKTKQAAKTAVGICSVAIGRDTRKQENKNKILALLGEEGDLSNSDIREELKVSDRTVIRYMSELEREGKVEQIGPTGRNVVYRLKP